MRRNGHFIWAPKIQFLRNTMEGMQFIISLLFIYFKKHLLRRSPVYLDSFYWLKVQRHISRSLRGKLEIEVRSCWYMVSEWVLLFWQKIYSYHVNQLFTFIWCIWKVWASAHWWYGGICTQEWRRLCMGMQKLWWRCPEWFLSSRFLWCACSLITFFLQFQMHEFLFLF